MADTAARWPEVERIYHAALELSGDARDAFVVRACGEDPALLADVRSLLIYESAAGGFLTRPALEHVARATPEHKAGSLTGRQIHGYELRSLLGAGGMGEVYLARDLRLGRDVALKILRRSVASDPGYLRRFEDEARSASVLNHPNIVTIYGVGEDGDIGYIAMERVNGRTLREIIASANLAVPAVLDLAVQLADALAVAHAAGIVHRDLKPDNVMVTPDGLLKVLDFGIAKREGVPDAETQITGPSASQTMETEAGTILGTVGYMSPEQAVGRRAGPASDQFSFGAIVYELLTGRRAFERSTKAGTLDAIKSEQPEAIQAINANVMPALRKVVERCLAKEPAQRFPKASDLALELRDIRERLAGRGLTRRQVLWLGSAAALAAAAAGGLAWRFWPREPRVRSVALLPFDNTGDDRSLDPFSEGITADLIRRIAVLPSIDVMAQSLVSNFKRMKLDARSFGRKIGAESVLTGSIARQGSNLTIAVALIEVASGKQLWSNSYARPAADLQGIQDAIASEIVDNGIRLQLSKEERALLSRRLTSVPAAYELFLQATYLREKGGQAELLQARLLLLRAVQLDPTFAQAYAVLAGTYSIAAIEGYELPREVWPDQYRYVREAMEHDQELPDAYAETANRAFYCDWTWEESERQWTLAMRSRGAEIESHLKMSRALMQRALGHTALALQVCREVRARDQLSPALMVDEANYLLADGRLDEAYRTYEQALRADPDLGFAKTGLIEVRLAQRNFDDAIDLRRQMLNGVDEDLTRILASARGEKGFQRIEAFMTQVDLDTLDLSAAAGQYVAPYQRAVLHARMGQRPEARRYLEAACDERDAGLVFLKAQRVWRPFDNDPRFQSVVRKVGLP